MFKGATVAIRKPFSRQKGQMMGQDLVQQLGDTPSACWLFCEPGEGMQEMLSGVYAAVGTPNLVGCTTDGEISSTGYSTSSAVLGGIAADRIQCKVASVSHIKPDSRDAGRRLGELLPRSRAARAAFLRWAHRKRQRTAERHERGFRSGSDNKWRHCRRCESLQTNVAIHRG